MSSRRIASVLLTALLTVCALLAGTSTASAWGPPASQVRGFINATINNYGMDHPVWVRAWPSQTTAPSKAPTIIFLDGLRATNDYNGWERETNVAYLSQRGYNVVMPIGGQSSFYADWNAPSPTAGQVHPYRWETVLKNSLPQFLDAHGFHNRTLVGLSMSASQAVMIGNERRDLYSRVVSMSGFMNIVATGMQTMMRGAAWDAGHYDLNDMWGWFPNLQAFQHSPTENLPSMNGLHLWMYAGTGVWGDHQPPGANNTDFFITGLNSTAIESVAGEQSRTFALAAPAFGVKLRTDFPLTGTHAWGYWQQAIWNIYNAGWFKNG
ncbi:putative secreted esterase [Gordonia polyisoprenivorans VH2]|uniref:Mycolyltransferase n=2 Tax=Gordonia polyisoprenivorans TaxID=84595 RepID=A0A846WLE5_9ACTN|nr:alpha/beta hydrolase family protein [Gordonia polyisoprenivorans]AFA75243.1 putative secreted esterase [Gordonia polyisoprenivorans VH2]MBE7194214.1 mycolyltransferase [Gordonia polyisoprenivorans]NKY01633.1 mycolyltransferase [Gordonia polyisoprenivorans]QUD83479.1 mycolyltransferase [Gordonia polyisoprenivorans]UZF55563.1 esterase family protein [Gordonia polyisoprenivorans]